MSWYFHTLWNVHMDYSNMCCSFVTQVVFLSGTLHETVMDFNQNKMALQFDGIYNRLGYYTLQCLDATWLCMCQRICEDHFDRYQRNSPRKKSSILKYWQVNGVAMIIVSFRLLTSCVDVSKSVIKDSPIRATSPERHDVSIYRQIDCSMFFGLIWNTTLKHLIIAPLVREIHQWPVIVLTNC